MDKVLIQKRGWGYRKFQLTDDKLIQEVKSLHRLDRKEYKLETIGYRKQYVKNIAREEIINLCLAIVLSLWVLVPPFLEGESPTNTIYMLVGGLWLFVIFSFKRSTRNIILETVEGKLEFYQKLPTEISAEQFVEEVIMASKLYTRNQHLPFKDYQTQEEKIDSLGYLLAKEVISKEEYDVVRNELNLKDLL